MEHFLLVLRSNNIFVSFDLVADIAIGFYISLFISSRDKFQSIN